MLETIQDIKEISKKLKERAISEGFAMAGIASIPGSSRIKLRTNALERWLSNNHHAEMKWMEAERRKNIGSLLKDGGVKSKIIKKYLPLINQQVNKYLRMMDFYINFKLDEEFNETIQSPIHEDFSYSSFSEGEKMRIDLALLFTWREVARFKNSVNTNLLIMDEVFDSSLDGFGTEEFLKIVKYVIKDANVFVISHKQSLHDRFEDLIQFEKVKGFSRMT